MENATSLDVMPMNGREESWFHEMDWLVGYEQVPAPGFPVQSIFPGKPSVTQMGT